MKMNRYQENGLNITVYRGISLLLALCLLLPLLPAAFASDADLASVGASSAGDKPGHISPSTLKVYVKLSSATNIFTGDPANPSRTETVSAGSVLQLVDKKYYTDGAINYFCLYYGNTIWSVPAAQVYQSILSDAQLADYITGTLWKTTSFVPLNKDLNLLGDVQVHSLQMALSRLGHYSGALDGNFGAGTESAVRNFQRANKLDVDGRAGPITQALLYPMALNANNSNSNNNNNNSGTSNASSIGTLKTTVSVNLRQRATTKSPRLAIVLRNLTLNYYETTTVSGITWYHVAYAGRTGWLMGSFVNASGSGGGGGGGGGSSEVQIGTVTIILPGTRVRQTPNGTKTGTVLAKGSVVPLMGQPSSVVGYNWYPIRTSGGLRGYVRGDCCKATFDGGGGSGGGGGGIAPSSSKTYIEIGSGGLNVFTAKEKPTSGFENIPAGYVIQLVSTTTYTENGIEYCSLYYYSKVYNAVYSEVKGWIKNDDWLANHLIGIWKSAYTAALKHDMNLVGDVRVHAAQLALSVLGFYTGPLDGNFGSGTESAVRNYQRKNNLTVDGSIGPKTWDKLFPAAIAAYGGGGGGGGGGGVATEFGNIISIEMARWDGDGIHLLPKQAFATLLDVKTEKVFTAYRWSGPGHADCVPATAADTKTMCDIVGFPYNPSRPSNDQLSKIKGDTKNNNTNYTWPDFRNAWGGGIDVKSNWDHRPALLNVNGRVFCVSLFGWPHGFDGTSGICTNTFASGSNKGKKFFEVNNYYGMFCVHFVDSRTTGTNVVSQAHQDAIKVAYNYAKGRWPSLIK